MGIIVVACNQGEQQRIPVDVSFSTETRKVSFKDYDESGELSVTGQFVNNKNEGEWIHYFKEGSIYQKRKSSSRTNLKDLESYITKMDNYIMRVNTLMARSWGLGLHIWKMVHLCI